MDTVTESVSGTVVVALMMDTVAVHTMMAEILVITYSSTILTIWAMAVTMVTTVMDPMALCTDCLKSKEK